MAKRLKPNKVFKQETKPDTPVWRNLPDTVLLNVYQYLGDTDRVAMAKCCKKWNEVSKDPTLWRKRIIHFDSRKYKGDEQMGTFYKSETGLPLSNGRFAIRYVQKFCDCLQELDIVVYLSNGKKELCNDFMGFAVSLDSAKLTKVKISFSQVDGDSACHRQHPFIKPIKRLLENQRALKEFIIVSSGFRLLRGVQLLKLLANTSATTMQVLSLNKFFWNISERFQVAKRIPKAMEKFQNLRRINLDYTILTDDLILLWARGCPALAYIQVSTGHFDSIKHSTSSEVWQDLIATHPNVLVEFRATRLEDVGEMLFILSAAMPLYKLVCELYDGDTPEHKLTNLLTHLTNYKNTIKHLFIKICGDCEDLDTAVVQNILSPCTHLLPFTCRNVGNPTTESNMWVLSQEGF